MTRSAPLLVAVLLAVGCAGGPTTVAGKPDPGTNAKKRATAKPSAAPTGTPGPDDAGAPLATPTPGLIALNTPTPGPLATATPTPGPVGATSTPAPTAAPPSLRSVIAGKLEVLSRISFSQGRADVVANNGAGLVANNGGGLVGNHAAGLIGNNAAGYRLAQAAPTIGIVPEAGERFYVKRQWAAGGKRFRFDKVPAAVAPQDYFRTVDLTAADQPVYEYRETVTARYANQGLQAIDVAITTLDPDGSLRLVRRNAQTTGEDGKVTGAVFTPNATKLRFPETGISLDIDRFSLDTVAKTGAFAYRFNATGHTETGTLSGVAPDAAGKLWFSYGDPLGYYAGASELKDAAGNLVVKKTRTVDGATVTRTYDLGDGLVMALTRGVNNLFSGPLRKDGVEVAQVALGIYGDGTTIYDLTFTDPAESPMRVGWGVPNPGAGVATPSPAPAWNAETVAGGAEGALLDGTGPAARFKNLRGMAASRTTANRWYLAEAGNHCIRRLDFTGGSWAVTTVAGTGTAGDADGPALSAGFRSPFGIAVAPDDTLYVSEIEGHRIRKIAPDGTVSVLAGAPAPGYAEGVGAGARFYAPSGLVLTGNAVVVADQGNRRIRAVALADGQAVTLAGDGAAGSADGPGAAARFTQPIGLGWADDGALLVADREARRIRRVDLQAADHPVTTVGGSGNAAYDFHDGPPATSGLFLPVGVVGNGSGGAYASYIDLRTIAADGTIRSVTGQSFQGSKDGPQGDATFTALYGLVRLSDGGLLVTDSSRVRRLRPPVAQ